MAKFCTSCGSGLNPEARFCTKCGAAVNSESAGQQQSYTGSYNQATQQSYTGSYNQATQQSYTGSYTQPTQQAFTGQYTPPVKSGGGSGAAIICIVLAAVLFLQTLVVLLFGWPGFLAGSRKNRLSEQPSQICAEIKSNVMVDFGSHKAMDRETVAI